MSVHGKAKNGVVVPPRRAKRPESIDLKVETLHLLAENDHRIIEVLTLAKPRPHWPKDFALNHAHHTKRHLKKA